MFSINNFRKEKLVATKNMRIKHIIVLGLVLIACSCTDQHSKVTETSAKDSIEKVNVTTEKIKVLNFGTFHMGFSTDLNQTKFDQNDEANKRAVHAIAKKLQSFNPTVIVVEVEPKFNAQLQAKYENYLKNPREFIENPSEVELLAFELGRLCGTEKIYGIDHPLSYNYLIARDIENEIDSLFIQKFYTDPQSYYPTINIDEDTLDLLEKLILTNDDEYLNFLMTMNADIMTHVGTNGNYEGADEATKYYQRNLRMYSNLNRIKLQKDDRVFILLGASHSAFFRDFISRSPKYELVCTMKYLK